MEDEESGIKSTPNLFFGCFFLPSTTFSSASVGINQNYIIMALQAD
jgi:hypothetical protein